MLLLCPLEKAIAAGDRIYGVILGSAVNHDGTTNGITAPNPLAQARVVAAALERAKIKPDQVQYLETHGTGTVLGDRIEAKSLLSVFSPRGAGTEPLRVGALKSNIGHAESAAGVGGLVKVLLSLRYETLPPSLHSEQPIEPFVAENSIIRLQSVCESWPAGTKRIAGVSGFGFGGTNAHVIIGEPSPFAEVSEDDTSAQHPYLFTLSAVCQESLEALVRKTLTLSEQWGLDDLKALCWTSNRSRAGHAFRLAILTERTEDLRASLRDLESHSRNAHIHHGRATRKVRELTLVIGNTRLSSEDEQLLIARFHAFAEAQREVSDANLLERGFSAEDTAAIGSLYSVARLLLSLGVRPCRFEGIGALGTSLAQVLSGRMNLCNLEKVSEVAVLERKSDVSCRPTLTLGISNDPWLSLYGLEESTGEQTTGSILWDVPTALARLYCSGADISFDRLFRSSRVVDLPSYPWHREEFWISDAEEPIALSAADAAQLVPGLPTSQSLERVRTDGPSIAASAGEISRSLEEVLRILREQVAQELAIASSADIDLDTGFFELGMDSLMALRIKARVESLLGLQLRDSVVLEYPTVRASGVHIHSLLASSSLERRVKDDVEIASGRHRLASRRARV